MNKKIIIYIVIAIVVLILIIVAVFNNIHNSNVKEIETNQNYSSIETSIQKEVIDTDNSIEEQVKEIETSIQEQVKDTNTSTQMQVKELEASMKMQGKEEKIEMIKIKVNNNMLEVKLEYNEATKSLVERLKNGNITINANEYGGFEKVGDLGFSLPRNDTDITTSAGDIVLYQGNQISLFYGSNSWSYTKLGKVQNISSKELKNKLGSGNVTLVFSLE